jgi:glycosyltransferase involved in cell wall biosynthesis
MIGTEERSTEVIPFTIGIPTYNRGSSVQQLLKAVCDQAIIEDEIIVSDDGSTDGTSEQAGRIPGVKVIRHEKNQGMVANWNACLSAATREWICILHDDDRLEPGALAALRRACALAKGPALILHRYAGSQFDGGFRYNYSEPCSGTVLSCPTIPSGAVLHRAIIDTVGLFDPRFKYSADLEYFPRIAARFPLIVIESPRIVEYRLHLANHQFQTWRQPDFQDQYEELQRSVISYVGIQDERLRRDILDQRTIGDLLYMLDMADRIGDQRLVRQVGKNCQKFRHRLSVRQRVMTSIAAITGWRPRRHRVKPLPPI